MFQKHQCKILIIQRYGFTNIEIVYLLIILGMFITFNGQNNVAEKMITMFQIFNKRITFAD
ncbi:MAG: hypothetical protein Kow0068_04000 [Marinilabiliales bacterium]